MEVRGDEEGCVAIDQECAVNFVHGQYLWGPHHRKLSSVKRLADNLEIMNTLSKAVDRTTEKNRAMFPRYVCSGKKPPIMHQGIRGGLGCRHL